MRKRDRYHAIIGTVIGSPAPERRRRVQPPAHPDTPPPTAGDGGAPVAPAGGEHPPRTEDMAA